jgi:SAM-dependent methyltransferase
MGYFAGADFASEQARLALFEDSSDPITFERLDKIGIAPGWRCLEVAGGGSVARWLAERVGVEGSVTAIDVDTRFLDAHELPGNVVVRQQDVMRDPLEPGHYDLVHCRALLEHLPDPRGALERMVTALLPGGQLVVEACDFTPLRSAAPDHPSSAVFDWTVRAFVGAMRADAIMDLCVAPRLPGLLERLGLVEIGSEGVATVHHGGSPISTFLQQSVDRVREPLLKGDWLTERDLEAFARALADPSFRWVSWLRFAAHGRRPLH